MTARGIRNNNPGNIEYGRFARKMGATGSDGRFAKFPTPEDGIRAIVTLQQRYEGDGLETVRQRISRWAPASENDVDAYAEAVAARMGIDPDTPFSINDPVLGTAFVDGMIQHENGRQPYTAAQIQGGHARAIGIPAGPDIPAIMDVASLNTAPISVPDAPTAASGFAPSFMPAPAQAAISDLLASPPTTPPGWAGDTSFPPPPPEPYQRYETVAGWMPQFAQPYDMPQPIDEGLTGASADQVLAGGPSINPRRAPPATGFMPPDMGAMVSPADVLNAGPQPNPRRASGSQLAGMAGLMPPVPASPSLGTAADGLSHRIAKGDTLGKLASRYYGDPARWPEIEAANPGVKPTNLKVGSEIVLPGVPSPPLPTPRPDRAAAPLVAGRPEFPGTLPPSPFASSFPPRPETPGSMPAAPDAGPVFGPAGDPIALANAESQRRWDAIQADNDAYFAGRGMSTLAQSGRPYEPPAPPTVAGRPEFPGNLAVANPPDFSAANPDLSLPPTWSPATSFPGPPAPIGTAGAGSTTGEFFTPGGWPEPSPPQPDPMAPRFDADFMPSAPGQIMDLQTAFDRRSSPPLPAPPIMTAQDGINSVFGAPPAQAMPSNLAIPFAEVPSFDMGRFANQAPPTLSMSEFDQRFGGGSVIQPPAPPTPGVTPGVVRGTMPQPMASVPPIPAPSMMVAPASPRQPNPGAQRQRTGIAARVLGGILGGPIGAIGTGILGGGGGGLGFGAPASFTPMGSAFSAPYMQPNGQMGQTNVQRVNSGNMPGTMWNRSNGGSVGYVTDPFTGAMIYSGSPTAF